MNDQELQVYLKKQAESIAIPDSLAPENIEKKTASIKQKKGGPLFRRSYKAAALLLLLTITALTGRYFLSGTDRQTTEEKKKQPVSADRLSYEKAYDAIHTFYEQQKTRDGERLYSGAAAEDIAQIETDDSVSGALKEKEQANESASLSKKTADSYTDTDVQVQGIMEGDIVKTDGSYLYSLHERVTGFGIDIYSVNGEKVKKVFTISADNSSVNEMYLEKNRLILVGELWDDTQNQTTQNGTTTQIQIYDVSNPAAPKKLRTQTQSGRYSSSRVAGKYLYTFSEYSVGSAIDKRKPATYIPLVNGKVIPEDRVRCAGSAPQKNYMVMTSLAVDGSGNYTDTLTTLGGADVYYVSPTFIYTAADASHDLPSLTKISKYRYEDGAFTYQTACQVRGTIQNSYYLHEQNGNLCFVYNKRTLLQGSTNGLCVLDKDLKRLGEIGNLGNDEMIYASYFMENMAYFVTYRETDPVFAVDLTDPAKPKLKSELKLPGYSDYLHSFGDDQLIGIGIDEYDTKDVWVECAKISIFTIDKKKQIKQAAKKALPAYTDTLASANRHSVLIDEERQLVGFLANIQEGFRMDYLLFSYNKETGKFKKLLTQKKVSPNTRGVRIGNYFYVVDGEKGVTCYGFPTCGTPGTLEEPLSFEAK